MLLSIVEKTTKRDTLLNANVKKNRLKPVGKSAKLKACAMIVERNPKRTQNNAHQAVAAGPIEIKVLASSFLAALAASNPPRKRARLKRLRYRSAIFFGVHLTMAK